MGPLRICELSLESKLTPHARPVVDREDGTFGKVLNLIFLFFFPLFLFNLLELMELHKQLFIERANALDQAKVLVESLSAPQQCQFLCCFELERKGLLKKFKHVS